MPFAENSFDAIICSELLEHVPSPASVLHEAYRTLRPGGTLFICVPFMYQIHGDPYDFGRYTDYYWSVTLGTIGYQNFLIEK
ncbi:class I SAM-dependent methyltransferase [bacterium]|nr:MAG: class I SAM-dependent methyltransferase [bacterium]